MGEEIMGHNIFRITGAGVALGAASAVLLSTAAPALADPSPAMHWGSDTRAKSQPQCMTDADFAIRETGLRVTSNGNGSVSGAGEINGTGVSVLVTCLSLGPRTWIQVVGTSQDSEAAGQARNRVRTITMGSPS